MFSIGVIGDGVVGSAIKYGFQKLGHTVSVHDSKYDTTINDWHTCPNTDRIYASNPCSEYMFLDNTNIAIIQYNIFIIFITKTTLFTSHHRS